MNELPTLVLVPCFAGAPWNMEPLTYFKDLPMKTFRLPDNCNDLEALSGFVLHQVKDLESYILVGDSYGAVTSLAVATRQPTGLKGLVISGGFAKNPITSPILKTLAALAPFFPGPFYRQLTLRVHAANLHSRFDQGGEIPWSPEKTRDFFLKETSHRAYVNRVHSIERADYIHALSQINVPTLILTPEEDRLIGKEAAEIMRKGIKNSDEVMIPRTGHMFRFSHPGAYSKVVRQFVERILVVEAPIRNKS